MHREKEAHRVIVKERELALVMAEGYTVALGDIRVVEGSLAPGEYFKVRYQLVCSDCKVGVREQDDHHCGNPDDD